MTKFIESAGGIVINPYGYVLVITNQIGRKTFPKGRLMAGEEIIDAARREIYEESGLMEIEFVRYLDTLIRPGFTSENSWTPSVQKVIHMFYCKASQRELSPVADDSVAAHWVSPLLLPDVLTWREELEFFEHYRQQMDVPH